jgi:bifunctional N-acetylglucosamine-1-phosphate-uridyltransferase/glucosamine-1-phosphate-acetyltransferase GlmU-like protein
MTMSNKKEYIIIMAGGSGTRMGSILPKQLLGIGNHPMMVHLLYQASDLNKDVVLIVSEKNKHVIINTLLGKKYIMNENNEHLPSNTNKYTFENINVYVCIQPVANGTGGAILSTNDFFENNDSNDETNVVILSADVPLISKSTVEYLFGALKNENKSNGVILVKDTNDNNGYGRIVIENNSFKKIVEDKDCDDDQKKITVINTGTYGFKIKKLLSALKNIDNNNSQGEYYITDCPEIINKKYNNTIHLHYVDNKNYDETLGANTPMQLDTLRKEYLKKFTVDNLYDNVDNINDDNIINLTNVLNQLAMVDIDDMNKLRSMLINNYDSYNNNKKNNIINPIQSHVLKYEENIVGHGTIIIEQKIIHSLGKVAHIEDIVIDYKYRGLGLSKILIDKLISIAKRNDCYKIILSASDDMVSFYEKLGFYKKSNVMRMDII